MITIRRLGDKFGLSRTALLHYDRIGLLRPSGRSPAGYRLYDGEAESRLRLICTYRSAGLSLSEIRDLVDNPKSGESPVLARRIGELDAKIGELRIQQRAIVELMRRNGRNGYDTAIGRRAWVDILESCGMDANDRQRWHEAFERSAPEAHQSFLRWLGIPEAEAREIRKRSRSDEADK